MSSLSRPFAASEPTLAEKVAFLSSADAYPSHPAAVEVRETHMSYVFLAGQQAWKLKKPVRYNYLDFSTTQARLRNCENEVTLNRRLAPGVYLSVTPLTADEAGRLRLGGSGAVTDWLVSMKRLPAERMLDAALREGRASRTDVRRFALRMCAFYLRALRVPLSPSAYRLRLEAETEECVRELKHPAYDLPLRAIEAMRARQIGLLHAEPGLFRDRAAGRHIVDAHGDLRPEHVCLLPEPVVIDCLEFNDSFRILDPVSELSFLALECERLGAAWAGELALHTYFEETGDRPPDSLLAFYKVHHALVRAKIAVWHLRDHDVRSPEHWIEKAAGYLTA